MAEQDTIQAVEEAAPAVAVEPTKETAIQSPKFDDILGFLDKDTRSSKTLEVFKGKPLDEALPQLLKNYVHAQQLTGKKVGLFSEEEIRQYVDLPVRPKSADEYLEVCADIEIELVDKYKDTMYDMGLDKQQAAKFMALRAAEEKAALESQGASKAELAEAAENALHEKFGLNFRKAMDVVKQAADSLGGDALVSKVFDAEVKDPVLIEALYKIGKEIGAGKVSFKETPVALAPEKDPKVERARLLADPEFKDAYLKQAHPGHAAAVEKMKQLYV